MVWVYVKHEVTLKGLWDEENGTLEMKVLFLWIDNASKSTSHFLMSK